MCTGKCTWRPRWSELRDALRGRDRVELNDALGGRDRTSLEIVTGVFPLSNATKYPLIPQCVLRSTAVDPILIMNRPRILLNCYFQN
jgi:hypothetical protein